MICGSSRAQVPQPTEVGRAKILSKKVKQVIRDVERARARMPTDPEGGAPVGPSRLCVPDAWLSVTNDHTSTFDLGKLQALDRRKLEQRVGAVRHSHGACSVRRLLKSEGI